MATKAVSADGITLRRGSEVWCIETKDAGKTWSVRHRVVEHVSRDGMVCFDEKIVSHSAWHFCRPMKEMVGDHRIYATKAGALAEANARNARTKEEEHGNKS